MKKIIIYIILVLFLTLVGCTTSITHKHIPCDICGKCTSIKCEGKEEEKCQGHQNALANYFNNIPAIIQIELNSEYDFKFDKEIEIKSNNKNVSIINSSKIMGVTKGTSIITISLKEDSNIKKEIGVEVTDDYVDPFPTIPNYIELPYKTEYTFDVEEDINVEFRSELITETEVELRYFSETKTIKSLIKGAMWINISSVSNPEKNKLVYIVSSLDEMYNLENGAYETYTFEYRDNNNFPSFLDNNADFSHYFIKDKAELFSLFNTNSISIWKDIPQNLKEIDINNYIILVTCELRGLGSIYGYSKLSYSKINNQLSINVTQIGSNPNDAMEQFIDIILIPKNEMPEELDITKLNEYKIELIYR